MRERVLGPIEVLGYSISNIFCFTFELCEAGMILTIDSMKNCWKDGRKRYYILLFYYFILIILSDFIISSKYFKSYFYYIS